MLVSNSRFISDHRGKATSGVLVTRDGGKRSIPSTSATQPRSTFLRTHLMECLTPEIGHVGHLWQMLGDEDVEGETPMMLQSFPIATMKFLWDNIFPPTWKKTQWLDEWSKQDGHFLSTFDWANYVQLLFCTGQLPNSYFPKLLPKCGYLVSSNVC